MARVTSLAFIIFLAVPIAAPTLGQWILTFAPWWGIFFVLGGFGALVTAWTVLRLPETLHPEDRLPINAARIFGAFLATLRDRQAVGYTLAFTLIVGSIFGYLNSAQQIFSDVFHAADFFPTAFGLTALAMVASALVNARIVGRFGMHRVSHTALLGFVGIAGVHALLAWRGGDSLVSFMICQGIMFFCLGLIGPNFGALSMEPLGHIAGTASSVQGFVTTVGGALVGLAVGQQFDGSARPLTAGFFLFASLGLAIVLVTERGRLFRQTHGPAVPPVAA
jgi:DHA1 family bicyclomycin/chloramphenicol resistance-like MFS transporter